MRAEYLWIAIVGLTWGGYPLVTRAAGYDGPRATLILMLAGIVPIALAMLQPSATQGAGPTTLAVAKLVAAGLLMGVGLLAFHSLMTSPMDASISVPMVDIAMLLVSIVGAIVFFGEAVTVHKVGGIALLLAGMAVLRMSP